MSYFLTGERGECYSKLQDTYEICMCKQYIRFKHKFSLLPRAVPLSVDTSFIFVLIRNNLSTNLGLPTTLMAFFLQPIQCHLFLKGQKNCCIVKIEQNTQNHNFRLYHLSWVNSYIAFHCNEYNLCEVSSRTKIGQGTGILQEATWMSHRIQSAGMLVPGRHWNQTATAPMFFPVFSLSLHMSVGFHPLPALSLSATLSLFPSLPLSPDYRG